MVITSHSWGEAVVRNFFWWVERRSRGWVEKHVAAFVNISGTVLGVPKVLAGGAASCVGGAELSVRSGVEESYRHQQFHA